LKVVGNNQRNTAQQIRSSPQPLQQYSRAFGCNFVLNPSTDSTTLLNGRRFHRPAIMAADSLANASSQGLLPFQENNNDKGQFERRDSQSPRSTPQGKALQIDHESSADQDILDQAKDQQKPQPQPQTKEPEQSYVPHLPQAGEGIVSSMGGMTLSPQASSSQNWSQQQSDTGIARGFDPETQVQSLIQKADPTIVTPPEVLADGIVARSRLLGTQSGSSEKLHPSFSIRSKKFFSVGRVFKVLWAEPAGANATVITRNTVENVLGERVHAKVRWFVVIREGSNYCCALPIATYGGRGVAKPGVVKSEHGIIYTGRNAPNPSKAELVTLPNEARMRSEPIRVDPDTPLDKLDPMSRINYAAVSTVQHNIKVKSMGNVNRNSIRSLQQHFQNVWFASDSSRTSYPQDQQGSTTIVAMSGRAGGSLGLGDFVVRAELGGFAAINGGRPEGRGIDGGAYENVGEDAIGGAASDSKHDGPDGDAGDRSKKRES
jgi:hypothetical protein